MADHLGVRQPDLRQEVGCAQGCQYPGVDLVGLNPGMRDRLYPQRIGHDHPNHIGRQHPHHRDGVAGRLDDNLVLLLYPGLSRQQQHLILLRVVVLLGVAAGKVACC